MRKQETAISPPTNKTNKYKWNKIEAKKKL
jgi:hypothetical protein